jgi:hypothetical protein
MTTWSIGFGIVAGLAALWSIRGRRIGATVAVGVGWFGLLVVGIGLHFGAAGTGGVPEWVPTWSFSGLAPMVALVACAPPAVLPAIHGAETDAASAAAAAFWSIALAVTAGVWPESLTLSAHPQGGLLIAVHAAAVVAALSVASAAAGASVLGWFEEGPHRGPALARRAVVLAWLAWPLAELVHWRILGTPGVGSPSEWFALGTVLFATGLVVASPPKAASEGNRAGIDVMRQATPVAVLIVLGLGVGVSLAQGAWFSLSLPM